MEIGIIGLGKMGFNLALNLKDNNFNVKGYDISLEALKSAKQQNLDVYSDLDQFLESMERKLLWVMLPSGEVTEKMLLTLLYKLPPGSIVIEGGNANYKDSIRRFNSFATKEISYLDVGTSGGISGARTKACLMIGGVKEVFSEIEDLFLTLAGPDGYLYAGDAGSGHFLKMVHNGIEYGMMQAIGEGFHILEESSFDFDLEKVAHVWNHGSVVRSWLMELTENLFKESPHLEDYRGIVAASGEGQWTVEAALELNVAAPVIAMSVMLRSLSQQEDAFSNKLLAGLRNQFGGHSFVKK